MAPVGYVPRLEILDAPLIADIVARIVRAAAPEKIVLFGSRARGDFRPESDIDILVVQRSELPRHVRTTPIYAALAGVPSPVDIEVVVYTPTEVEEWASADAAFVTTALRQGQVLYEK
jgi:predicted nucleotidyltransferase